MAAKPWENPNIHITEASEPVESLKSWFDISRIPDSQKDIIQSFWGKIVPYKDGQWRPGVRIFLPAWMQAYGGDWNKMERNTINGLIELDGSTSSVTINKPLPIWQNSAMVVRIIATDVSGWRDYADIVISQPSVQENINPVDQIKENIGTILNPKNNPQFIMDNIDYIVANASKLTQEQVTYFRGIIGYVITNTTGLEVRWYDKDILNMVYLKFWVNHHSIKRIDYDLNWFSLKKESPQYNELLRRKWEILSKPPAAVTITSTNWRQFNFSDPYFWK